MIKQGNTRLDGDTEAYHMTYHREFMGLNPACARLVQYWNMLALF